MPKKPNNNNKTWTSGDVDRLQQLAQHNTPTRIIGLKMDRTEASIRSKAADQNISLKPTNQSPYNRKAGKP